MTSPISARIDRRPASRSPVRRGFTLIEMLVVIGIMIVLMGILVPTVSRMAGKASRTAALADLEAIAAALEEYKKDFGDYPRVRVDPGLPVTTTMANPFDADKVPNPPSGAQILCAALYGPARAVDPMPDPMLRPRQDGADGPGFRVRTGGKIYPPYLPPERFRIGIPHEMGNTDYAMDLRMTIIDRYNKSVLYFPAALNRPNVRMLIPGTPPVPGYFAPSELSLYDTEDNLYAFASGSVPVTVIPLNGRKMMRAFLGDDNTNGLIDGSEQPYELPFLLWSAGPDEVHGPQADMAPDEGIIDAKDAARCDDVTNFRVNNTR